MMKMSIMVMKWSILESLKGGQYDMTYNYFRFYFKMVFELEVKSRSQRLLIRMPCSGTIRGRPL